jgi:hypothetical protein
MIVPETAAPLAGEVMLTVGRTVSRLFTVTEIELVPVLFAASLAVAVRVWVALVAVFVFQEQEAVALAVVQRVTPSTERVTEATPTLSLAVA